MAKLLKWCQEQSPMDTFEANWIKKARPEAKLLNFAYFNLTPLCAINSLIDSLGKGSLGQFLN
jgi:signal-transduction protein with cAMP-binding, CBS, and nucleotidyltransferase domain